MHHTLRRAAVILLTVISAFLLVSFIAGSYTLSDFKPDEPPPIWSAEWHELNNGGKEFAVIKQGDSLEISDYTFTNQCGLLMAHGRLTGTDYGEWGGELKFYPNDSAGKSVHLFSGNIHCLFRFQGNIYFLEGLAHLSLNDGALYRIDTTQLPMRVVQAADLNDAPQTYAIRNDSLIIVTNDRLYIYADNKTDTLLKKTFWWGLYPNSMVCDRFPWYYIGMRGGIARVNILNRKMIFFRYDHS